LVRGRSLLAREDEDCRPDALPLLFRVDSAVGWKAPAATS
jgi:hypothetical protein